jgi:hypothetical protein
MYVVTLASANNLHLNDLPGLGVGDLIVGDLWENLPGGHVPRLDMLVRART